LGNDCIFSAWRAFKSNSVVIWGVDVHWYTHIIQKGGLKKGKGIKSKEIKGNKT
jgi:hypothetical protein